MTLMKSQPLPATGHSKGLSGFWYEAVDAQGGVIYRQTMADPFDAGTEVFGEEGITRTPHEMPESTGFDFLIPDLPAVVELRVFGSLHEGRAECLATLPIRHEGGSCGRK
jgi:hypothetical protein